MITQNGCMSLRIIFTSIQIHTVEYRIINSGIVACLFVFSYFVLWKFQMTQMEGVPYAHTHSAEGKEGLSEGAASR